MKKLFKKLFNRTTITIVTVVLEILFLAAVFHWFGSKIVWIESVLHILSVFIVLGIVNNSKHLSSDVLWVILIVFSPVFGTVLYLFLGADLFTSKTFRNLSAETAKASSYFVQDEDVLKEFDDDAPNMRGQIRYISESTGFPFYRNEGFDYYGLGDTGYPVMLEELKKAKRFIFMEYFIIEAGEMWDGILKILEEKVKEGVEVRVMYDDLGSFFTLDSHYAEELEAKGIKCTTFNKINPILNIIVNHRDHRKILVIDGEVAFSGGVNLADEYINVKEKYGHWKDNVIRVKGPAVWSYTALFLTNWNALRHEDDDYTVYKSCPEKGEADGYIAPYADTPLDNELVGQNVYMNILNQANDYVYIATPYLIIDTEFINALILCAKRGVDVRIITPGIPDKKIVWGITRSYYRQLMEGGVKIYEYTPGFIHSKVFVADDIIATIGTINLDYRSLYLHFENGTFLYDSKAVLEVKKDLEETIAVSTEVTKELTRKNLIKAFFIGLIKPFSPLM